MAQAAEAQSRVDFRMPESLKAEVEQAAASLGISLTAFFSLAAVERAREVNRHRHLTLLDSEERDAFIALMFSPPEPNEALARLMRTEVEL